MSRMSQATKRVAKGVLLYAVALGIIAVAAISMAGCGGGNGTPTPLAQASVWKADQVGATYIGETKCATCHAAIEAKYKLSNKGNGVSARHQSVGCQNCHVTGPEVLPFDAAGAIDAAAIPAGFNVIGCEDCHGPGSKHEASYGKAQYQATITKTPPAKQTCIACHGGRPYNSANKDEELVTAETADLKNALPAGTIRGPHHTGAAFLLGRLGYEIPKAMPGAHASLPNTCVDCHTTVDKATGMTDHSNWSQPNLDTDRAACSACHNGRAETYLQDGIKKELKRIGGTSAADPTTYDSAGKAADGALQTYFVAKGVAAIWAKAEADRTAAEKTTLANYKGAMWNFKYIIADTSFGVHNPEFAHALITKIDALLK